MTTSIFRLAAAGLCVVLAACAQAPAPAPSPDTAGAEAPDPRLRGLRPADASREDQGVGVGGVMHGPGEAR